MDLQLSKESITVNEVVFDSAIEQPIECDVILPDYCPDIQKILKCLASVKYTSNQASGDKLTLEGFVTLTVYYLSDQNNLRCSEHKVPFSKSSDLKAGAVGENPLLLVNTAIDYLNCRAINQRRIDIRGAFTIGVRILSCRGEEVAVSAEGAGIQLKKQMTDATQVVGEANRQFTVREELEAGYGKPPVAAIIRSAVRASVTDYKVIANKVIVKGELAIHLLYSGEEEDAGLEMTEYSLPISQIVDMEGVQEDCICGVRFEVINWDIQPKQDDEGEWSLIAAEVTVSATVRAHRGESVAYLTDAYSTAYETANTQKSISLLRLSGLISDKAPVKDVAELPENIEKIIDVWGEVTQFSNRIQDGEAVTTGKLLFGMFAIGQEGTPVYYEKTGDFVLKHKMAEPVSNPLFDCFCTADGVSYTITADNQVEIRCDVMAEGYLYDVVKKQVLADILVDASRQKKRDSKAALTIYYADKGESIWEIAQRYNTSVTAVMEENDLAVEELAERSMLLIPMVG